MRWAWFVALSVGFSGAISIIAYGCNSQSSPPELSGNGTHDAAPGVACVTEGATQPCHATVTQQGNVLTCFAGTQTCVNGFWSACGGAGTITTQNFNRAPDPLAAGVGAHTRLLDVPEAAAVIAGARKLHPIARPGLLPIFEQVDAAHVVPAFIVDKPIAHRARVSYPVLASAPISLEALDSEVAIGFRLLDATDAKIAANDGLLTYAGALAGADVIHRPSPHGTEDYVAFAKKPATEELRYAIDVSHVAGLRLVASTLEFVDSAGAPRLRVAPPFVVDAKGRKLDASLALDGCAFDASAVPPWNRAVTAPGAKSCTLHVSWANSAAEYPLVVDPAWTATGSMAVAREFHSVSPLKVGYFLAAGGDSGTPTKTAELYNPATGTWAATGSMSVARGRHVGLPIQYGVTALVAGGTDGVSTWNTAEIYNPATGTFSLSASTMISPRRRHAATVLSSNNVLITGGLDASGNALASAEIYNPYADTFTATASPMLTARSEHTATLLAAGPVLIAGGTNGTTAQSSASTFDESTGVFTATTSAMVSARLGHSAVLLASGKVLLAGGSSGGSSLTSAELFDPTARTFSVTTSMSAGRQYAASTLLSNGQAMMAGGTSGSAALASAESYDPVATTWSSLSTMSASRMGGVANALSLNNKVLMSGGFDGTSYLSSAELLGVEPGGFCASNADCISGSCNHNICCSGSCSGSCTTCQQGSGACVSVTNAYDPVTCASPNWCNALGQCAAPDPNCANNPCDPTCRQIANDGGTLAAAEAGLLDASVVTATWFGVVFGSGGAVNPNFAKTGLNDCTFNNTPCQSYQYGKWAACQYDTYCNPGTCTSADASAGSCLQYAGGQTSAPLDGGGCPGPNLTAGIGCIPPDGGGFDIPICNRGNAPIDAGTTVALMFTTGSSYKYPAGPQCATTGSYSPTCAFKLPSTLQPGFCADLTPNTPGASATAGYGMCGASWVKQGTEQMFANADLSINECLLPGSPYDSGTKFGCDDNWSDLHQAITCSVITAVTGYGSATFTQQYVASCPAGTHVQWSQFGYNANIVSNSSGASNVQFQMQTAPLLNDGGIGTFGPSVDGGALTVANPPTSNAPSPCGTTCNCSMSGDGGPCPLNLYSSLGGAPYANNQVLNLTITLNPTPDQQAAPSVSGWQLTYSCPPSE